MDKKIEITSNAQEHIAQVLKIDNTRYFRITVLGGGCAGFQYKFDFDNLKNKDDIIFKTEKIEVVIDNTSLELIKGLSFINDKNEFIFTGHQDRIPAEDISWPDFSILEEDKNYLFELKDKRKFDYETFKYLNQEPYIKKISV